MLYLRKNHKRRYRFAEGEAGWERELKCNEYTIYVKLCNHRNKEIDVSKKKEIDYNITTNKKENNTFQILSEINSVEKLEEFISGLKREYRVNSFKINDMLISKSIEFFGNIDYILDLFFESNYPSNTSCSINSHDFWMTVVSALKNEKSKSDMFNYLLTHGGGHDGFSEVIKIYGYLGYKEICVEAFGKMLDCVEFLLC